MRWKGSLMVMVLLIANAPDVSAAAKCDLRDASGRSLKVHDGDYGASIDYPISLRIPELGSSALHAFTVVTRRDQPCFADFSISTPSLVRFDLTTASAGPAPAIRLYAADYEGTPEIRPESSGTQALSGAAYLLRAATYVVRIDGDPAAAKTRYGLKLEIEDQTPSIALDTELREPVRFARLGRVWTRSIVVDQRTMVSFLVEDIPTALERDVAINVRTLKGSNIDAVAVDGLRSTFVLQPDRYLVDVEARSSSWPVPPLDGPLLTAPITLKVQDLIPKTLPPSMVNLDAWLREVGMGNIFEVIEFADYRDPRRGLPGANERLLLDAVDVEQRRLGIDIFGDPELAAAATGNPATKKRPRFVVRLNVKAASREEVSAMESAFEKRHGAGLWNRVLQKVAATEAIPAYDVAIVAPVPCDPGLVFMDEDRAAYRHGFMCISSSAATRMPRAPMVASAASLRTSSRDVSLAKVLPAFLPKYIPFATADFEFVTLETDYAEVIVRGLRGTVIRGGADWEKLQLTFFFTGSADNGNSMLRISGDGQIASGMGVYPPDSQFIRDLEPKYAKSLQDYTKKTVNAFRQFLERSP